MLNYSNIKTGVIGVGSMGQNHARVYSEISNLVGVSDVNEAQVNEVANRFGIRAFTDFKELIDEVDAVSIAVPTLMHKEIANFASSKGKHILVEKPLASNSNDAISIINSAKKNKVILSVGHIERHNGIVDILLKNYEGKKWGDIQTLCANRFSNYPERISDVGVLFDLTIHDVDIILSIIDSPVKFVFAAGNKHMNANHEDQICLTIGFDNNVIGICQTSWLTPMKVRELNITTTSGYIQADYLNRKINILESFYGKKDESDISKMPITIKEKTIIPENTEPLKNELIDFLKSIAENTSPLVTGEAGLQAVKIVEAGLKSLKTNSVVKF